jgi:hypothetical protein
LLYPDGTKIQYSGFYFVCRCGVRGAGMKKASEYREHAEQCRVLAKSMPPGEQRDQLLEMAATWDRLAIERSELVRRHPELALGGEREEEVAAGNNPSAG